MTSTAATATVSTGETKTAFLARRRRELAAEAAAATTALRIRLHGA